MNKPIKDYTLGEAREICNQRMEDKPNICEGCPLKSWCDEMTQTAQYVPCDWDLTDPPRWTPEEAEQAKAVRTLYDLPWIVRSDDGQLMVAESKFLAPGTKLYFLSGKLFPTLKPGEIVALDEIIDGNK